MSSHNDLIEKLSETTSVSDFFSLATAQLGKQLDDLVERVFRQPNFALKSVVDSLFEHQGPLADRAVKLKLLLGLGVLSAEQYQDLALLFEALPMLDKMTKFSEPYLFQLAEKLHYADLAPLQTLLKHFAHIDESHTLQHQMQQQRIEKMLRSCLILAIIALLEQLDRESPL